ncbi:MAG: helix-hairpin-helix domain-containing protein, partial [Candidatus Bipolaricaulia bacterium]
MERLEGTLERIVYESEENGYMVARLAAAGDRDRLVTIVGNLAAVSPGEHLVLEGSWSVHPKYGRQFEVKEYKTVLPATEAGIQKYLGSGLIKGIGPVLSKRIIEHFGKEALRVIEEEPERLQEVEGIGPHRVGLITRAWEEQKEIREVMLFL